MTLSRLLLKLRKGNVVKFVREIRMYDDENWERGSITVGSWFDSVGDGGKSLTYSTEFGFLG